MTQIEQEFYGRVPAMLEQISNSQIDRRTWLAGMAMQGYISHTSAYQGETLARIALRDADALIEELDKTKEK